MNNLENMPSVIRLGAFDIDVKCIKNPRHPTNNRELHGCWDGSTQTITIDKEIPTSALAVSVLLHEINHALYWFFEIADETPEEQTVACLSTGLATIIRDNPELIKWIQKGLK